MSSLNELLKQLEDASHSLTDIQDGEPDNVSLNISCALMISTIDVLLDALRTRRIKITEFMMIQEVLRTVEVIRSKVYLDKKDMTYAHS